MHRLEVYKTQNNVVLLSMKKMFYFLILRAFFCLHFWSAFNALCYSFIFKQNQMIWPKDQPKTIWKNRIIYTGVVKLLLTGGIIKWFSAWVNNWAGWHIAMMEKSRGKIMIKKLHSFFCFEPIFRKKMHSWQSFQLPNYYAISISLSLLLFAREYETFQTFGFKLLKTA